MSHTAPKMVWLAAAIFLITSIHQAKSDTIEVAVSSSADDAEQSFVTGRMVGNASSDLEIGVEVPNRPPDAERGVQYIGVRFQGVTIPAGSTIDSALIQFAVDEPDKTTAPANFIIMGDLSPNASAFNDSDFGNISDRNRTSNAGLWLDVPAWSEEFLAGPDQATSDLSAVLQEIVDQPGWAAGNAMAFSIAPYSVDTNDVDRLSQANRTAVAFDRNDTSLAPVLRVEFSTIADPCILLGDFDCSRQLDAADIDLLTAEIVAGEPFDVDTFDLSGDNRVDDEDLALWVKDLKHSYFGDANLDGEFDSGDLVALFTAGEYEDGVPMNSSWATGDFDGDGDFGSGDLVAAFIDGGYEQGPRPAVNAVPEPVGCLSLPLILIAAWRRRGRTTNPGAHLGKERLARCLRCDEPSHRKATVSYS